MASTPKYAEEYECQLKGDNPVVEKLLAFASAARGLAPEFKKGAKDSGPLLLEMERVPGTRDTWKLMFNGLTDAAYAGMTYKQASKQDIRISPQADPTYFDRAYAEIFNRRLTTIGKRVLGNDNFKCDASFAPGGNGTGMLVMNWRGITTCKIKFPDEPVLESDFKYQGEELPGIKVLDNVERIDIDWSKPLPDTPVAVNARRAYHVGYYDSDTQHMQEMYQWKWCKE
jgi:hypothetical protein